MKAIVEQYAKGEFSVDRPEVVISETSFNINIEAGTVYEDSFLVESRNNYRIKGMVYDSRYMLRFESHSFISRKFEVRYSFDATCLEAGQNFHGLYGSSEGGKCRGSLQPAGTPQQLCQNQGFRARERRFLCGHVAGR